MTVDDRWPAVRDAALAEGFKASLSMPLNLGATGRGGVNMYGDQPGAFTAHDQGLATGFAAQASIVVANAHAYWAAFDATKNLTVALESRAIIEQAKGVLIARHGLSDDDAFDELRPVPSSEPEAEGHRRRDRRRGPPRRSTMNDTDRLDAARRQLGLTFHDRWVRYIGLGGNHDTFTVRSHLRATSRSATMTTTTS